MLNKIWGAFFFVAFLVGVVKTVQGDSAVWAAMVAAASSPEPGAGVRLDAPNLG